MSEETEEMKRIKKKRIIMSNKNYLYIFSSATQQNKK